MKEKDVIRLSVKEYCLIAATSPRISETMMMTISAVNIRISVRGRRCWIIRSTGCWEKKELPRFPWTARPSHFTYCTGMG